LLLSDFDYHLPPERIAQTPVEPRDSSRLMVLDRRTGDLTHTVFNQIGRFLSDGDLLILNTTRVIPARLFGTKHPGGGKIELLLLQKRSPQTWEALVGGKGMKPGRRFSITDPATGRPAADGIVEEILEGPARVVRFDSPLTPQLDRLGQVPLPPYIHEKLADAGRYQTVYAHEAGSAAAPTAGLHFTPRLLENLRMAGVRTAEVILHIGLDTFAPVHESDPRQHRIHSEWCRLPAETAAAIQAAKDAGKRVVCVGSTSVRTVESAAAGGKVRPFEGPTDLYILPGYEFRAVDAMVTNFHLPRSTLMMMVSALAGLDPIRHAYQTAIREKYRFYSFGDAMLIL